MAPWPLLQHHRQHVAHAEEHALQIDADHLIEDRLVVFLRRRGPPLDAGVVEEAVDRAVGIERRLHVVLHLGGFRDIGTHEARIATALAHEFGARLAGGRVEIDHHDLGAASREADRAGATDAAATAGDQGHLACEFHRSFPLNRPAAQPCRQRADRATARPPRRSRASFAPRRSAASAIHRRSATPAARGPARSDPRLRSRNS